MDELIAFLNARLDEDERIAKAAEPGPWVTNGVSLWRRPDDTWDFRTEMHARDRMPFIAVDRAETNGRNTEHIARHDPARVLADVAAKRAIVEVVLGYEAVIDGEWGDGHLAAEIAAGMCEEHRPNEIPALRLLALPYAGHPDYREEWRP